MVTEVLVVGAGIVGAACALEFANAGCKVTVVDRGPVSGGTTGAGEGNILVSDKGPGPELELALLSNRLWQDVVLDLDCDVELERKGGLVVAPTPLVLDALATFAEQQSAAGVTCVPHDERELLATEPYLRRGTPGGMFYPQDMQVQPMRAAAAMLRKANRLGAKVLTHLEVTGVRQRRDGSVVGVQTARGDLGADVVVNAAGAWAGHFAWMAGSDLPVAPRRGFVLVTAPAPLVVRHKVYSASYVADVASGAGTLQSSAVVEGTASGPILIGATREIVGFDAAFSMPALRRLATQAVELFPALAGLHVLRSYYGFRPFMPDHLPAIGEDPNARGLMHACGHEGAGIGLSTGTARLVADAALGRPSTLPLAPFSPGRFAGRATRTMAHA